MYAKNISNYSIFSRKKLYVLYINTTHIKKMSTKNDWFSVIYSSLSFIGFILLIIALVTSSTQTSIAGYTILVVSVLLITTFLYNQIATTARGLSFLLTVLSNLGPFVLILGILIFSLYLTVTYMNEIQQHNISNQYYTFSGLSTIFILVQILFIVYGMQTPQFQQRKLLPGIYTNLSYLFGVVNVYLLVTVQTILKNYVTDGWRMGVL